MQEMRASRQHDNLKLKQDISLGNVEVCDISMS